MIDLKSMRNTLNQAKGKRSLLAAQLKDAEDSKTKLETVYEYSLKARLIAQEVASATQSQLEIHISNLVSLALKSVFPDPYLFTLKFVQRRNKTEADLIFSKKGNETDDILNSGGGGVADVASFALRIACWSLKKTRPCFLLDETAKYLHSPEYQEKFSEMLKELSTKLGIQIILVSDQDDIKKAADKVINVKNVKGISTISENI
jgi:hypothetical protein